MRQMPPLKAIQAFEASSRLSSIMKAAEELCVTPSAISHQVRVLEEYLGVKVFHRVHRSIVLTDAGQRFADEVATAFGGIETATLRLSRTGRNNLLSIHAVPSFATQWLMPRLSQFSTDNPDVDVRLHATHQPNNVTLGIIDCDIRYGQYTLENGAESDTFPEENFLPLCSPRLVEGERGLHCLENLRYHVLIHGEANIFRWADWARRHPGVEAEWERGLRFDRSFMAIGAAVNGLGVCLESQLLVERELRDGLLVSPFGEPGVPVQCHSIVYSRSKARSPKLLAFRLWILDALFNERPC